MQLEIIVVVGSEVGENEKAPHPPGACTDAVLRVLNLTLLEKLWHTLGGNHTQIIVTTAYVRNDKYASAEK